MNSAGPGENSSVACGVDRFDGMEQLESLFSGHMRARAMLRQVAQAEHDALIEIVRVLKEVPGPMRQRVVVTCVKRAAAGLIGGTPSR